MDMAVRLVWQLVYLPSCWRWPLNPVQRIVYQWGEGAGGGWFRLQRGVGALGMGQKSMCLGRASNSRCEAHLAAIREYTRTLEQSSYVMCMGEVYHPAWNWGMWM